MSKLTETFKQSDANTLTSCEKIYIPGIAQLFVSILCMNVGHHINQKNLTLLYSPILSFSC